MIIVLALLDDIPVMLIASDNADVAPRPSKWDMNRVLLTSAILAGVGFLQSYGLVSNMHRVMHLALPQIQTGVFMQLVIGGHLLLFSTRVRGPFWKPALPSRQAFLSHHGNQGIRGFHGASWLARAAHFVVFDWIYLGLQPRVAGY